MIELKDSELVFSFPGVHPSASVRISFQRTLRIPDNGEAYPLPPGLGRFPLRHVDDHADRVPPDWVERGGVMLPMYQSEALWILFRAEWDVERCASYPVAVKVATGKVNAVSGKAWSEGLRRRPRQDYLVVPDQPWLDGYCVAKGVIRQFVAMPLGSGYTAEEQLLGRAENGGLQVAAFPMKREAFEKRFPKPPEGLYPLVRESSAAVRCCSCGPSMGLAPGGRMRQSICADPYGLDDWDVDEGSRCFVHIANSLVWRQVTGEHPPTTPPTAEEYTRAGLPWFLWYDEQPQLAGSKELAGLKSVAQLGRKKHDVPLPENAAVQPGRLIELRPEHRKRQVREFKG